MDLFPNSAAKMTDTISSVEGEDISDEIAAHVGAVIDYLEAKGGDLAVILRKASDGTIRGGVTITCGDLSSRFVLMVVSDAVAMVKAGAEKARAGETIN